MNEILNKALNKAGGIDGIRDTERGIEKENEIGLFCGNRASKDRCRLGREPLHLQVISSRDIIIKV